MSKRNRQSVTGMENPPPGLKVVKVLAGHRGVVEHISWSPDGRTLASSSADERTIRIWDVDSGKCLRTLKKGLDSTSSLVWSSDGAKLALGLAQGEIGLWTLATGNFSVTESFPVQSVRGMDWSPDGQLLAFGSGFGFIGVIEASTLKLKKRFETSNVDCVAFSPSGKILASGDIRNDIVLWDRATWTEIERLKGHDDYVKSLAWHPDGTRLASSSDDKTLRLWNLHPTLRAVALEGHTESVKTVRYGAHGQLLASASVDGIVRIWRGEGCVAQFSTSECDSYSSELVAFHPQSPLLATLGSDRKTLCLWQIDLSVLLSRQAEPTATYSSAKIVMVGESNVGKSYLAHRIATGVPPKEGLIKSTHGMAVWQLELDRLRPTAKPVTGQRRDVMLWDMGGQEEYRLVHQLFLRDTTVALVLFDPTRGATAFKEVETWNKSLEKQLRGQAAVKLLVGAKLDQPSDVIDRQGVERLVKDCGFSGYYETSAITGRGLTELCEAAVNSIDWEVGKTSRPELFQRIRDEIEARCQLGDVLLNVAELIQSLGNEAVTEGDDIAVKTVVEQLAKQGRIAISRLSSGELVLVLQIQEIERYAGALILAARNNPRGVPALELSGAAHADFPLPGIAQPDRLPRNQERSVLECTFQLMLEHGICFQHEGLLIFPSLFAPEPEPSDAKLPHSVALYYDFAGAIDNIYASLIAWLVLARDFGKLRLWRDRAELETKAHWMCGLRKVSRPGGFAHVDVYFDEGTPERQRHEFIGFVEDHLERNGVEIREHVAIKCACSHEFAEETLRQRIARGEKDVACPVCERRHTLTEGAAQSRERDADISQHTWALRTRIEKLRGRISAQVVQVLGNVVDTTLAARPIRLLHLSDLHFTLDTPVQARLQWLLDDLKQSSGLGFKELDYLVISGDFTEKGEDEGFDKAYAFVSGLTLEFGLSAERCIFVPGNHDLRDLRQAYDWREKSDGLHDDEWVKQGEIILARNPQNYPLRLKPFSDVFFHKFIQRPYPLDYAAQGMAIPFWETRIQFLTLNSCWQIDQFHRKRSGLNVVSVATAIKQAQAQEDAARKSGQLSPERRLLRIAVWHHSVAGPEQMKNTEFLGSLQKNGVRLALHGDVHEERRELIGYSHESRLHVVGAGSFGARGEDRPESVPRLYNVLEIVRDLSSVRVHTRCQPKPDSPWKGWNEWDRPDGGEGAVPYYDIRL